MTALLVASGLVAVQSALVVGPVAAVTVPTPPTNAGRDFWLASPPATSTVGVDAPAWELFVTSRTSGSVTVQIPGRPGGAWSKTVALVADAVTKISLPAGSTIPKAPAGADLVKTDLGIHVTSTVDVSVVSGLPEEMQRAGFVNFPTSTLGTRYRALSYDQIDFLGSYVAVVGTQDGTSVTVTMIDGTTEAVSLDKGETFAYSPPSHAMDVGQGPSWNVSDSTGIVVTATKPIGVYAGANLGIVPLGSTGGQMLVQMMPPTRTWGTEFLAVRLGTRIKHDVYRVLADRDDTEVRVNGTLVTTLDEGAYYEFSYPNDVSVPGDQSLQISASKPILVGQYATTPKIEFDDWDMDPPPNSYYADSMFMLVPPTEQYLTSYAAALPNMATTLIPNGGYPGLYWTNLVVPTAAIASVRLNGVAVSASEFTAIRDSGFSGAQVSLPTFGTYRVTADAAFGMHIYAWGVGTTGAEQFDSYGFPAGTALASIASVTSAVLGDPTVSGSGTAGSYPEAEVTLKDDAGKGVSGVEVTFEVTDAGANDQVVTDVTDASGVASATFPGKAPESGILTVDAEFVQTSGTITWSATVPRVPSAPQLVITQKDGGLSAAWKAPASSGSSAITQYKVVAVPGGKSCTVTPKSGQKDFTCTVTGLTNGKSYSLESYARNDAGWSEKDTFGPKTPASLPGKPRGLAVVSKSADGTLVIEWDAPADDGDAPVTSYVVLWRLRDSTKYTTMPKVSVKTRTINDLKPGARYRVAVAARNVIGRGQEAFFIVKMPN